MSTQPIPPPMEMGNVDAAPKRIRKASAVPPPVHSFFHTALYFPLKLPQDRILKSHDRAHRQHLVCFAIVFWLIIILAAAGFLGVWFIGYSGAHLSSSEERASFQVVGLYPDGRQINPIELSYCSQSPQPLWFKQRCLIGSASEIVYPDPSGGNIFVVTRLTLRDEVRLCPIDADRCTTPVWTNFTAENITFWASPESMTIRVTHAITLKTKQFHGKEMYGDMVDQNERVIATFDRKENEIPLGTFLQAAGLDLDTPGDTNSIYSHRYNGAILNVVVTYTNWNSFKTPKHTPHFRYRVYHVPKTEYRVIAPQPGGNNTNRVLDHRRGVSLQFTTTGKYYSVSSFNVILVLLSTFFILGDILIFWQCFIGTVYNIEEAIYEV